MCVLDTVSIAFVDDHKLLLETLSSYIKSKFSKAKVKGFDDSVAFVEQYTAEGFGVLVVDLEMPGMNGIEVIKAVRKINPDQCILVLSMFYDEQIASELRNLGVQAFLSKTCDLNELEETLKGVLNNQACCNRMANSHSETKTLLTKRELEIIKLSAQGLTSPQIGNAIFISEGTVKTHIKNIMDKTQLSNFKEVIAKFQKEGLDVLL